MIDSDKKLPNLFLFVSHEKISLYWLKEKLENLSEKYENIKFKCEPPILHILCKNLDSALKLLDFAKVSGFKHSGINSFNKNFILEINGSDRLEFPIIHNKKILVNEDFLKIIVDKTNKKLEKGWRMINNLFYKHL